MLRILSYDYDAFNKTRFPKQNSHHTYNYLGYSGC